MPTLCARYANLARRGVTHPDPRSGRDLRRRAWILVVTQQSDQAKARLSPAQTPWPLNRTRSRVRTSGRPQPSFALGSSEGTAGTDLGRWLTSSDAFVDAWAER